MYKTILVPLDLDDEETAAKLLPAARSMAESAEAGFCVMTAVPETLSLKRGQDERLLAAKQRLGQLASQHLAGRRVRQVIASGPAGDEVLRVAKEIGADLIVIGSHRPRARDLLLGSTATEVVRRAACSVLVVRP